MWKIEQCLFHPELNLIVGMNASGKTRIVNTINNLGGLLSGRRIGSGNWEIVFQKDQKTEIQYSLSIENYQVLKETFIENEQIRLERDSSGKGTIWAEKLQQKIEFQIETRELAAVKKCDSIQHPFLSALSQWSSFLRTYRFATDFGRNTMAIIVTSTGTETREEDFDKDPDKIIALYNDAIKQWGYRFFEEIKKDMQFLNYNLKEITIESVGKIQAPPASLYAFHIQEEDLEYKIPQREISQGMFRALALIIHLNYLQFSSSAQSCILIDDIGEGLDFERSSRLIKLIFKKFFSKDNSSPVQIFMTSNDRFVMNAIPLDYWLLIDRIPGGMNIFSKKNSPEMFEEFEFTGLNNFDFLASEYFKG